MFATSLFGSDNAPVAGGNAPAVDVGSLVVVKPKRNPPAGAPPDAGAPNENDGAAAVLVVLVSTWEGAVATEAGLSSAETELALAAGAFENGSAPGALDGVGG